MKKIRDNKALLFENMAKLNPDFITEGKDWIQGAINPAHKGDCTPMSKPTCTGHKKALANRFKSGDLSQDEGVNLNMLLPPGDYKRKANELKAKIDELLKTDEFEDIDTLYRLMIRREKPIRHTSPEELREIFEKNGH